MQIKTKAIVFHSFKCNDNRIIVDFHILDCGRLSVAVTVSNSRKTKFRKTLLSQLTLLYRARCAPAGRTEDSHRRQLNSMTKRVDGFFFRQLALSIIQLSMRCRSYGHNCCRHCSSCCAKLNLSCSVYCRCGHSQHHVVEVEVADASQVLIGVVVIEDWRFWLWVSSAVFRCAVAFRNVELA